MVLVTRVFLRGLRIEEIVAGHELEDHAGQRPDVSGDIVASVDDRLGRAVLPRLDVVGEVPLNPACIPQVRDLVGHAVMVEEVQAHDLLKEAGVHHAVPTTNTALLPSGGHCARRCCRLRLPSRSATGSRARWRCGHPLLTRCSCATGDNAALARVVRLDVGVHWLHHHHQVVVVGRQQRGVRAGGLQVWPHVGRACLRCARSHGWSSCHGSRHRGRQSASGLARGGSR
mmetsp:Transcript_117496/g.251070  ORF Transcript_117496/g.251070 Transcript_117496/m.251070 type:complete len:229 (-) Transcript_117496:967-1653(-)